MKSLTKSALLDRLAPTCEKHDFADGSFLYVRMLLANERDAFEQSMIARDDEGKAVGQNIEGVRARLLCMTLLDENKQRIFSDDEAVMVGNTIGAGGETMELFKHAQRLNGFGGEPVKEEVKKSEAAPTGGLPSASASPSDLHTPTIS